MTDPRDEEAEAARRRIAALVLAVAWLAFAISFLIPASSSSELVVVTEGSSAFGTTIEVHAGWQNFQRALLAMFPPAGPYAFTGLGNLVLVAASCRIFLRRWRRWPAVLATVLFALGLTCLLVPGEHFLAGAWLWLATQAVGVAAAWWGRPARAKIAAPSQP